MLSIAEHYRFVCKEITYGHRAVAVMSTSGCLGRAPITESMV